MKTRCLLVLFALGLGLALVCALRGGSTPIAAAPRAEGHIEAPNVPAAELHVCPSGCTHSSIQDAVDAANDGDVIKVAAGTYAGVQGRAAPAGYDGPSVITQVVYISKTVTIRGGYTSAFTDPPDPEANPTTLDAEGQGRVLYITAPAPGASISPTIEGLRITGGDAAGLGGAGGWSWREDAAGGVYVVTATATISDSYVFSNNANVGGGLYLDSSDATLSGNTISANTADGDHWGGGGVYLRHSDTMLSGNTITDNTATQGGGLYLYHSDAMLSGNTISANMADGYGYHGSGGGLYLTSSDATLSGNTISDNTAQGNGGGVSGGDTLIGNIISGNTAYGDGGGVYGYGTRLSGNTVTSNTAYGVGGGLCGSGSAMIISNTVTNNAADEGGGLYLRSSDATLNGNTISSNTAQGDGGGLRLYESDATLINNVVADNQADTVGSGLYIGGSSLHLLHTTIARNSTFGGSGDGSGIYVGDGTMAMTNTILVSHSVGVSVTENSTVTINGVLWHSTPITVSQSASALVTVQNQHTGNPAFVDPDNGDYHIGPTSAAVDVGIASGVTPPCLHDIDGDPRPAAFGFDIGADERPGASLRVHKAAWPVGLNSGQTFSYTLVVISAGVDTATDIWLTDTLPALQQAVDIVASQGSCTAGSGWGSTAICRLGTLLPGTSAHITLTAQVTATPPTQLPWRMRNTVRVKATETSYTTYGDTTLHDCHVRLNDGPTEYSTVQAAVDASTQPADVVKVAGYCAAVTSRADVAQIVYLDKTLVLQGGWNAAFTKRNVASYPTTLDAWGQGRVLFISGSISPTIEGLRITGGDAAGLGGGSRWYIDAGGGVYVVNATVTIRDSQVLSNTAKHYGGGLYLYHSDATLSDSTVMSNTASRDGGGLYLYHSDAALNGNTISTNTAYYGGGLYLYHSDATLSGNTISDNTAAEWGWGGGLFLEHSEATLSGNTISANTAADYGGGLTLMWSSGTFNDNIISTNTAGVGGGLYLYLSDATLSGNIISANTAVQGNGGGLEIEGGDTTLIGNTVTSNTAGDEGGGLHLWGSSNATFIGNTITSNTAEYHGGGVYGSGTFSDNIISANTTQSYGGGVYGHGTFSGNTISGNTAGSMGGGVYGDGTFSGNTISGNTAGSDGGGVSGGGTFSDNTISGNTAGGDGGGVSGGGTFIDNTISGNTAQGDGGGVYGGDTLIGNIISSNTADRGGGLCLYRRSSTLTNNILTDNRADTAGSGLYIKYSSPRLLYNTIARNSGGDGSGIYVKEYTDWQGVTYYSTVALTNTILVSHTVGITVAAGNTATLEGTLWGKESWANTADWGGAGTILTGTINIGGDPAFVNPDGGDYHIAPASAAVNQGVAVAYPLDVDGDYRPLAAPPDLGADEVVTVSPECQARLNGGGPVYTTLQTAISVSTSPTDVVEIAGVCEDSVTWDGSTYVAVLTKTLMVQGGYSLDFGAWDPANHPTVFNGRLQGGVLGIGGGVSPTVEHLTLLGGQALEGGGLWSVGDGPALRYLHVVHNLAQRGGGIYLGGRGGRLEESRIESNWANDGGGIYMKGADGAIVSGNTLQGNTASSGGGLYLDGSDATLSGNTVSANTASAGGGLYLGYYSDATLSRNTISGNIASNGGGLYLGDHSGATLSSNIVSANTAWRGGGLYLWYSDATLSGNIISANTANGTTWRPGGGGLYLWGSSSTLTNNIVADNQATTTGSGLYIMRSSPRLLHTTIARNTGGGSGIYITHYERTYSTVVLTNTILVSHTVGIYVEPGDTATLESTLWNGNGTNWSGWGTINHSNDYAGNPAFVDAGNGDYHIGPRSAALDAGVDAGVDHDIDGDPRPLDGDRDGADEFDIGADERAPSLDVIKQAKPGVVQPGGQLTYTIRVTNTGSITLTATVTDTLPENIVQGETPGGTLIVPSGVITWTPISIPPQEVWTDTVVVTVEMDYAGPLTNVVEVTTKEGATGIYTHTLAPDLEVTKQVRANTVRAGERLTYTITVTNTGNYDLHATITDTLPAHVTTGGTAGGTTVLPGGKLVWTPLITAPGGIWMETVVVTMEADYTGPLTNVVDVTTEEGATGRYVHSLAPGLEVAKRAHPDAVQAGEQLTYTITITNTGNFDLHATITDTLPAHVTTTQPLVWSSQLIPAPDGVWTETIVVTVEVGYTGPLTNVVRVTTVEGVTGIYSKISEVVIATFNQAPYTPSNPIPADFATDVPITQTLRWQGGDPDEGDTVTYTIVISTSGHLPIIDSTMLTSYTPILVTNTTYYWDIAATDSMSTVVGPVWRFTTAAFEYVYLPVVLRNG